jgi:hypothetical protein
MTVLCGSLHEMFGFFVRKRLTAVYVLARRKELLLAQ